MKLYDRPKNQETLDRLPELPEGVEVPDDVSGLQPPTTLRPTGGGIRWMRWLAVILVLGAIGLAGVLVVQSYSTTEIDRANYMELYGTDNPVFVQAETYGSDRNLSTSEDLTTGRAIDYMEMYGTDNPVSVQEGLGGVSYMEMYGTDNPVRVQPADTDLMEIYGTDNPIFVESRDHPYAEFFG